MRKSAICALLLLASCFGPDPNVTDSGRGLPEVSAEFPERVQAGSEESLVVTVSNPGPEDMLGVTIAFTSVAVSGRTEIPDPLVVPGVKAASRSVVAVSPEPVAVSPDGVSYRFSALDEGESLTVTFTIRVPDGAGFLANSVTAYDSQEVDRARGVRVETTVER